jgi:hypothetical protein
MNVKFRYLYLLLGAVGFVMLFYYFFQNLPEISNIDPIHILVIAVPDMLFFFLAYKTYPPEKEPRRQESYQHRKVSNY